MDLVKHTTEISAPILPKASLFSTIVARWGKMVSTGEASLGTTADLTGEVREHTGYGNAVDSGTAPERILFVCE